jgi:hypothetical protein
MTASVKRPAWSPDPAFKRLSITDEEPKPVNWGVKPYLDLDNLGLIIGPPHGGKTTIGLYLALCIASGREFFGSPTRQARVGWLDMDGINPRPVATMISRIRRGLGITPKEIEDTFFAAPPQPWTIGTEKKFPIAPEDGGGYYVEDPGKTRLVSFIEKETLDHVFIDVLSAIHTKDETNEGMRDVVRHGLGGVVMDTGCGITILAHTRKALQAKPNVLKTLEDAKGGIELVGAPSIGIIVQRVDDLGLFALRKSRDVPIANYSDVYYRMTATDGDLGPVTFERVAAPKAMESPFLQTVDWLESDPARLKLSIRDAVTLAKADKVSTSKGTMERAMKELLSTEDATDTAA